MKAISLDINTDNGSYTIKLDDANKEFIGKLLDYLNVGKEDIEEELSSEAISILKDRLERYNAGKSKLYSYNEVKEMLLKKF